jgi:hypothetical protein
MPDLRIPLTTGALQALLQFAPHGAPLSAELRRVAEYLDAVRYYYFEDPGLDRTSLDLALITRAKYEEWKSGPRRDNSVFMRLLDWHLADDERGNELQDLLGPNGLGLISGIEIQEVSVADGHAFLFRVGGELAGASRCWNWGQLSEGTRRVIRLLTHLLYDENSCMLLEQPEDCIHMGLLEKIIDILRTYSHRTQLICTTHSPQVMNMFEPQELRMVFTQNGATAVSELTADQRERAVEYLSEHGILAEFIEISHAE